MKELHECVSVWYEDGRMKVKLENLKEVLEKTSFSGKVYLVDVVLEIKENKSLELTGKKLLRDGRYTKHRILVKNLPERPHSRWIRKDLFGREYVKWVYEFPEREDNYQKTYLTYNFDLLWDTK